MFLVNRRGYFVCRVPSLSFSLSPGALLCGVNGKLVKWFSGLLIYYLLPSWRGAVNTQWVIRTDLHLCRERGVGSLITHISIVTPMCA